MDYFYLCYTLLLLLIILIFGSASGITGLSIIFIRNIIFLVAGNLLVYYFSDKKSNAIGRVLRHIYPMLLFTMNYADSLKLAFLIFPNLFDEWIISFERMFLKTDLLILFERHINSKWLTEILTFGYSSYYLMLPILALILYFKKNTEGFFNTAITVSGVFYFSYLFFILFPVNGPWRYEPILTMFEHPIEGFFLFPFQDKLMELPRVNNSGCFPSSHVAVAVVITLNSIKYLKMVRIPFIIVTVLMFFATFYLRFHYITDSIAGLILAFISYPLLSKFNRKWLQRTNLTL